MFSVLVLEIDGDIIRSAVVKRRGWRKFSVSHCYEMKRWVEPEEPLKLEELAAFTAKIPKYPKNLVVVSSRAMMLQISFEKADIKKARFFKLSDLVRKESANYTGFTSDEIFFGYEKQIPEKKDEKTVSFQVAVCHKDYFASLKDAAWDMNFKLKRLYPPEVCFPAAGLYSRSQKGGAENEQALFIDVGMSSIKVCRLLNGKLAAARIMEAALKESEDDLWSWEASEEDIGEFFDSLESTESKIIISGQGGKRQAVLEFLKEKLGAEIKKADILLNSADESIAGCEFAAAIGAGLRELGYPYGKARQIGITDTIPFVKKIGDKLILIPVGMLLLFFVLFMVHNWFITQEIAEATGKLEQLSNQRDHVNRLISRVDEANNAIAEAEKQKNVIRGNMHFLRDRIPEYNSLLHVTLAAMKSEASPDLMFVNIQLLGTDDQYLIQGESLSSTSIMNLALALQNADWSLFAKVEEIIREQRRERIPEDVIITNGDPEEIIIADEIPEEIVIADEIPEDIVAIDEGIANDTEEYRTIVVYRFRIRLVMDRSLVADLPIEWVQTAAVQETEDKTQPDAPQQLPYDKAQPDAPQQLPYDKTQTDEALEVLDEEVTDK